MGQDQKYKSFIIIINKVKGMTVFYSQGFPNGKKNKFQ